MPSIRISPDFSSNRYSSLSFGSYHRNYSISLGSGRLPSPRCAGNLLGPCFNTGPTCGLIPMYFLYFILFNFFHLSLAVLLRYRPLLVFSLGCSYHPFILHYQAILLCLLTAYRGLSPPPAPLSIGSYPHIHNFNYHRSSFLFVRHYYGNPSLFLFLSLLICLSSGRTPASPHHSNLAVCTTPIVFVTLVFAWRTYPSCTWDHFWLFSTTSGSTAYVDFSTGLKNLHFFVFHRVGGGNCKNSIVSGKYSINCTKNMKNPTNGR